MKRIAFFFPPYFGHINKTLGMAHRLAECGHHVTYFIPSKSLPSTSLKHPNIGVQKMQTPPWGMNNPQGGVSVYEEYTQRKKEVELIIQDYNPDVIFLDDFCCHDYLIWYPHLSSKRIIILTPFLPSFPNSTIPPLHQFVSPGSSALHLWAEQKQQLDSKWEERKKEYNLQDYRSVVLRVASEINLPQSNYPEYVWHKVPNYPNVEKWYLQPEEFDFPGLQLRKWEKYVCPEILHQTSSHPQYDLFCRMLQFQPKSSCILCSLGTVITELIKDKSQIQYFFEKFILLAEKRQDLFFALLVPDFLLAELKPKSMNVMLFKELPFFDILSKSDVFVTHGSGASSLEAIEAQTPLLVVPPTSTWDYQGNAARIVYHGIGLKADMTDTKEQFEVHIEHLLSNPNYKKQLDKLKMQYSEHYSENYYEMLVQNI